jgi:hypothetical protein
MYNVGIAKSGFVCPESGLKVRSGEVYVEKEGRRCHISQIPARKLRRIETHPPAPFKGGIENPICSLQNSINSNKL